MGTLTNSGKLIEKIESKQDELTAGEGIAIGTEHSDMQGPAPDGFHVPTKDEWDTLSLILFTTFSLLSWEGTLRDYLKMPLAGYRWMGGSVNGQFDLYYWTSTASNTYTAFCLIGGSGMVRVTDIARSNAASIRCFKNTPVVPDNSWTTLYDGSSVATGAGIFHNTTDGLISISGDGVTWYTIQDKNLGATEVFNGGTVTDANSGYFYQWGNNYGFAHSGDITTSSTQVDASNYGPGNYYNSSTFITRRYEDESYDWSSVSNDNLWGGTSQGTWISEGGNVIGNTGVISVNGKSGRVNIITGDSATGISTSMPNPYVEGSIYYDTTNNILKIYDGKEWKEINYNSGKGIFVGNDYSAMRGPCPEGFHIPDQDEWQKLLRTYDSIYGYSADWGDGRIACKIPMAGSRGTSSSISNQGTEGMYWTRGFRFSGQSDATYFRTSQHGTYNSNYRSKGMSIRPFKDVPVVPDNSWIATSQNTGNIGVFRSSSLGLISISDDGEHWITIADKNLGATTVWNDGDTLSEANCGKYYQRGNNYGFPRTGTISNKSSTQVDASTYGPGNYYSSDTWITSNSWDSSNNGDLRGGISGVIINAITNTGVLSVNGQTGDVTIPTTEESNTKTFYLSSTSDLTTAQAAYDWYNSGKDVIIRYGTAGRDYTLMSVSTTSIVFGAPQSLYSNEISGSTGSYSGLFFWTISFTVNNGTVTSISSTRNGPIAQVLDIGTNYSTPYTPQYSGSPATKKYVDDAITSSGGGSSGVTTNLLLQGSVHKGTLSNPNCSGDSLCSYTFQGSGTVSNISYCTICGHHDLVINNCNLGCLSNYQGYTINAKSGDVVGLCYVHGSHYNSCNKASLCYVDIY